MTSREMFEQFFASPQAMNFTRVMDGPYKDPITQIAWEAWRQSSHYHHDDGEG